jgi:hypothetical protein
MHVYRGAKERQFLRDLLQPLIKLILQDNTLDLETDPVFIYKNLIREEELKTGEQSRRSYDVTPQQAAADVEVQKIQTERKFFFSLTNYASNKSVNNGLLTFVVFFCVD